MQEQSLLPAMREMTDEALMARYADGDAEAFAELFGRYERRVHAYFLRRSRSAEHARDLYQELFLRIHRARDQYDPTRPFSPWLFQIARRLLVDELRRAHRARELPLADAEWASADASSEARLGDREVLGRVLAELSDEERYILVSAKLDGIAYPELAARLGKSAEAVRKTASRALQRVRSVPIFAAPLASESR